jgi:hypothetical protein
MHIISRSTTNESMKKLEKHASKFKRTVATAEFSITFHPPAHGLPQAMSLLTPYF